MPKNNYDGGVLLQRQIKGTNEAKEYMAKIRAMKKNKRESYPKEEKIKRPRGRPRKNKQGGAFNLKNLVKDIGKMGISEAVNVLPAPSFLKEPIKSVGEMAIDKLVDKIGGKARKNRKIGHALNLP
jgi:hypothetical protein